MVVIIADRTLAVRPRIVAGDAHGDRIATGFGTLTAALPGLAQEQGDTPLGQPGDRTWVLDLDPSLWPVGQQDLVVDPVGELEWTVTSAQLLQNARMPLLDHIRCEARLYSGGSRA